MMQASHIFTYDKVTITPQKQQYYEKQHLTLQFELSLSQKRITNRVTADHSTKKVEIEDENRTILSLAGKGSFQEVDFISADGECIGSGSYKELPNMPAESYVGLNRRYDIYLSNNQSSVAYFHQVHCSNTNFIRLHISQQELNSLTKTLLLGKLVMMALLDPGFLHFQYDKSNESQCVTKIAANHILPNFILPDWVYPAQLRMRIVGSIIGEKDKRDYYVLFDPSGKPWYIMETNNSTELKVLNPVTYQPLLIADKAASIEELCTITTPNKAVIGKFEGRSHYVHFDDGFRKVYKMLSVDGAEKFIFFSVGDSRYRKNSVICECHDNETDKKEIPITFDFPTHRLGLAVLLPAFCIFASRRYEIANIQAPVSKNIEDLCLRLKDDKV